MKIGIFDSGLGGLLIFKELSRKLPKYDYVYLGDVKRLPYGSRSDEAIFEFTKEAVRHLFDKENCKLIILACNTASARALRRIQQEILPKEYPDRRVLGVIIPTAEEAINSYELRIANYELKNKVNKIIGVLATSATVRSGVYKREINKLDPKIKVFERSAPSLVSLIENGEIKFTEPLIRKYLKPILGKMDTLILGCTHYPLVEKNIKKIVGKKVRIISQNKILPGKLSDYLKRHPEIENCLDKDGGRKLLVTEMADNYIKIAKKWFGKFTSLMIVNIEK